MMVGLRWTMEMKGGENEAEVKVRKEENEKEKKMRLTPGISGGDGHLWTPVDA